MAVPISAGRPATVQAIEAAMANDRRLFAVCQIENRDEIESDNLHQVGVIVKIMQVQRAPGVLQLLINRGQSVNVLWQAPGYIVLTLAEVLRVGAWKALAVMLIASIPGWIIIAVR